MGKFRIETEGGHTYDIETEDAPPSYPKPPLPPGLQGPPPGKLQQMIQNIPGSALKAIQNPYGPGIPSGNPVYPEGQLPPSGPEAVMNELKGLVPHPIEDPVGTALQIATLGKYRRPIIGAGKGAVQGATEMVPLRHYGIPMNVPAPVAGAAVGGFTGWLSHLPHASEVGAAIGAGAPIVKGAIRGVQESLEESPRGKPAEGYSESSTSVEPPGPVSAPPKFGGRSRGPKNPPGGGPGEPIATEPETNAPLEPGVITAPPKFKAKTSTFKPPQAPPGQDILSEPQPEPKNLEPGVVYPPQRFTPKKTPQKAASENAHVPGATQADEFGKIPPTAPQGPGQVAPPNPIQSQGPQPIIPPSGLTPKGGAVSPQGPATPAATEVIKPNTNPPNEPMLAPSTAPPQTPQRDPALQALFDRYGERVRSHLEAIPKKEANIIAWAKESKVPVSELESLRNDLEQADDPKSYAAAIDKAKTYAKDIHSWGKDRGRDVPKDYRTFDLQDIETAIKALKSQLAPIPKQP